MELKQCILCSKDYKIKKSHAAKRKYCSLACFRRDDSYIVKIKNTCAKCTQEFLSFPSEGQRVYCSKVCAGQNYQRITRNCLICTTAYAKKPSKTDTKYCSKKCRIVATARNGTFWNTATKEEAIDRIRKSYEKFVIKHDGCWDWSGYKNNHGYGVLAAIGGKGKTTKAHRASWIIHKGDIPEGLWILHHCDNPACSNPDHLYAGTPKDNSRDAYARNRMPDTHGENHPRTKLTNAQVIEIKKLLLTDPFNKNIAALYNVAVHVISSIRAGKSFRNIKLES